MCTCTDLSCNAQPIDTTLSGELAVVVCFVRDGLLKSTTLCSHPLFSVPGTLLHLFVKLILCSGLLCLPLPSLVHSAISLTEFLTRSMWRCRLDPRPALALKPSSFFGYMKVRYSKACGTVLLQLTLLAGLLTADLARCWLPRFIRC